MKTGMQKSEKWPWLCVIILSSVSTYQFINSNQLTLDNKKMKIQIVEGEKHNAALQDELNAIATLQKSIKERDHKVSQSEALVAAKSSQARQLLIEAERKSKQNIELNKEVETCQVLKFLYEDEPERPTQISSVDNENIYMNSYYLASKLLPLSLIIDEKAYISSFYGKRKVNHPKASTFHRAIDVAAKVGTPIYSPAGGFVTGVRPSNKGSGNFLRIQHAFGFSTSYSHLSSFNVKTGDYVKTGDMIARVGNTGISTGPHLHYEVLFNGKKLNPEPFYEFAKTKNIAKLKDSIDLPWDRIFEGFDNISFGSALIFTNSKESIAKEEPKTAKIKGQTLAQIEKFNNGKTITR